MQLSVVLVSYNSRHVLAKCLSLLKTRLKENLAPENTEIIVVDNHSEKEEQAWLKKQTGIKTIYLPENVGFARANNVALEVAGGEYILFLNTDVYLEEPIDFQELVNFLAEDERKAGLTVKVVLQGGQIDPASHRGFPTPFNALSYFSGLEKLTAKMPFLNRVFGGYHLTSEKLDTLHQIDSPTAAFWLIKRKMLVELGGFDPDYFFYGEDLDLSYRLKQRGYEQWYYPRYKALHLKYQSGQKSADQNTKRMTKSYFFSTMALFLDKNYRKRYPGWVLGMSKLGIKLLAKIKV